MTEYGIKYKKVKIDANSFLLVPTSLIEGYSIEDSFYSTKVYKIASSSSNIVKNEIVIDGIMTDEELMSHYQLDDIDFLKKFYLSEEKDSIILITIEKGIINKKRIPIRVLLSKDVEETFSLYNGEPVIELNEEALNRLLNESNIDEIKKKLAIYKDDFNSLKAQNKEHGLTSVTFSNGRVKNITTNKKVEDDQSNSDVKIWTPNNKPMINTNDANPPCDTSDISVRGLEQYLKERIFGHEKQLKKIATILVMNYRSKYKYGTKSILIPGPTGTGKTATFKSASEYLNLPFFMADASNLVPQGIKGTSIEDIMYALLSSVHYDNDLAERALIVFDEFDKLGKTDLDIKATMPNIFLKFIEGTTYNIDKMSGDYTFDTKMSSKIFLGAFPEFFEDDNVSIGFATSAQVGGKKFNKRKLYKSGVFNEELLTRISHTIVYEELTRETKKRAILESKISEFILKKQRYEEEFGITLVGADDYIEGLLDALDEKDKSMRDLNNLISESLLDAEYEIVDKPNRYKKLVLSRSTVTDSSRFDLS